MAQNISVTRLHVLQRTDNIENIQIFFCLSIFFIFATFKCESFEFCFIEARLRERLTFLLAILRLQFIVSLYTQRARGFKILWNVLVFIGEL